MTSSSAQSLTQHCRLTYNVGVSATPTVKGSIVYFPTWDGQLVALNYRTCAVRWIVNVTDIIYQYGPVDAAFNQVLQKTSRTSPQIDGNVLFFGTQAHALLVALDVNTGATLASIQVNPHPLAILTMSPTVYNGRIFIGTSSTEEYATGVVPNYPCCSFIGNFGAFDFNQASRAFTLAWNVNMLPANEGWSGAAVWGSQPSIDIARSQVFIATGNVYELPEAYQQCQNETANIPVIAQGLVPSTCIPSNVLTEAVIAFDIQTGLINWARILSPLDAWQLACGGNLGFVVPRNFSVCPYPPGPDADFGMAPTFVPGSSSTPYGRDIVVVGQKNGDIHTLSAQAGTPLWSTVTGPSGLVGGLIWGIAVDDTHVYFSNVNNAQQPFTLLPGNATTITNSGCGAASLLDGSLTWEIATPNDAISVVPPSGVNDVVFFGRTGNRTDLQGGLVAVNKADGVIIRDYGLDSTFHGGIAIQDQYVMFGTGYYGSNGTGSFYVMSANSEQCFGHHCGQ